MNNLHTVLLLTAIGICLAGPVTDFNKIADQYFKEMIEENPEFAARLGIPDGLGFDLNKDRLTDSSPESNKLFYERIRRYKKIIDAVDEGSVSEKDKIFFEMFKYEIGDNLILEKFKDHGYTISTFFSFHNSLLTLFTEYHQIEKREDIENYIKRLSLITKKFDQIQLQLDVKENIGVLSPDFISKEVASQFSDFLDIKADKCIFLTNLETKMKEIEIPAADKEKYLKEVGSVIAGSVYPAYKKMLKRIKKEQKLSDDRAGVWKLPDGDEYYKACLKIYTTSDLTPEEIHQIGLKEVNRIQDEMMVLLAKSGFSGNNFNKVEGKWWKSLRFDDANNYENNEKGKNRAVEDYMKIIDDVKKRLPDYFSLLPKADIIVKRVHDYKSTVAGAFYESPSFDGKRPGIFFIDMHYPPSKPGMKTLTYHEAVPGHHLQIALEGEIDYLKYFRSAFSYSGFVEGWALYAERLAYEEGWNKDVNSQLSYLNSELFRAVRLVLDTGIHYKRWSLEKAEDYMDDNLGWSSMSELYRYCVAPGHACSYKIGEMKLLELRERMKKELKDSFDIKEFHRLVLENGQIPLAILEKKINNYIAEKKRL